jgi:hypothetical protein
MTARMLFALMALWLSPALFAAPARTAGPALPTLTNAVKDVLDAANPGVVVVVLFSLPGCHYCEEVRNHYLAPLARDGAQRGRLVIREVDLNSARRLTDFDGSQTTQAAFAKRMKVQARDVAVDLRADGGGRFRHQRSGSASTVGLPPSICSRIAMPAAARRASRPRSPCRHAIAAAGTEDVLGMAALGADVDAHVLDDAEDGDADLLEHLQALARVEQRDVLRRGDDHRAGHRHLLRQRELDVAGARRHVDDR